MSHPILGFILGGKAILLILVLLLVLAVMAVAVAVVVYLLARSKPGKAAPPQPPVVPPQRDSR